MSMSHAQLPVSALLALRGVFGGWDELIVLIAGVIVAIAVAHVTQRTAFRDDEDDLASPNETRSL